MAQLIKSISCSSSGPSRGPKFNSYQPHDGKQPIVMRAGASGLQGYIQREYYFQ